MIYAVLSLAALGLIFGLVLGMADKKFAVEVDPRVEAIANVLPGANCGSCGFPGCNGYAEAIVAGTAPLNACAPGKEEVSKKIAEIMGTEAGETNERKVVQLLCKGGKEQAAFLYQYEGLQDCHVAATMFKSPKVCSFGCIGLGSCVSACPFAALKMGANHLPEINYDLCVGCGKCAENCPQQVLKLVEASHLVHVRCRNKDKGILAKKACTAACIKCKLCEKNCPEGAISVVTEADGSGVAVIDYTKCTNCGVCVSKCPTKVIEKMLPLTVQLEVKDELDTKQNTGCSHCGLCQ